jgi:hypothetical protein
VQKPELSKDLTRRIMIAEALEKLEEAVRHERRLSEERRTELMGKLDQLAEAFDAYWPS